MDATIHRVDGGLWLHGLGMTYGVGLALMIFGSALLPGAFIGALGLLTLLAGTVLIGIAVAHPYRSPEAVRSRLLGGLLLIVGLVGNIPLALVGAAWVYRYPGRWGRRVRPGSRTSYSCRGGSPGQA